MKRRPQFRRSRPTPMRPTVDDLAMCRHLKDYRLASFSDLCGVVPHRAPTKIRERLRTLYDNRYVDRPRAQCDFHVPGKRPETIYALGDRGAELLAETDGWSAPKSSWTDKNRTISRPNLLHTLAVAKIRAAIDRLPSIDEKVAVISADTIIRNAPTATRNDSNPWAWQASIIGGAATVRIAITVPDHFFGLDSIQVRKRFYFMVEADRATMPITRSDKRKSSIYRKFEAYLAGHRARYHHQRYGVGNMRFLFLTSSGRRIDTMLHALSDVADGADSSMFLFTETAALSASKNLLNLAWRTSNDNTVTLNSIINQETPDEPITDR